jgi:mono/diheme cytochrome c family protein
MGQREPGSSTRAGAIWGIGVAAALAVTACAPAPVHRTELDGFYTGASGAGVAPSTGAAGDPEIAPPPSPITSADAGVALADSCGGPDAGSASPFQGGVPPTIPSAITRSPTNVPPISGGTLLALADGQTAVASDPERDQVYVVDLGANVVHATVKLQAGDEPGRLVEDATGQVHVALRGGGAVVAFNPKTGAIAMRRNVCAAPRGIAFESATSLIHVACADGVLVSLPAAGGAATRTLTLGRDLRDVVVGTGGDLLVSTFRAAAVLDVASDGTIVNQLRPASGMSLPLGSASRNVSPAVAWRMVPYAGNAGSVVMLHQMDVDDPIDSSAGAYGGFKGCGAIAEASVSVLTPGETPAPSFSMEMVSLAVDLAVSPDGSKVGVAVPGNAETPGLPTVAEVDMTTVSTTSTPFGPCVGAGAPSGSTPPVGQVVALSYTPQGVLLAQTREPAALWRSDTSATVSLATDSRADTGHLIFHVNAGGGLACASCHPEGGEDGRVWNFTCLGERRTQSIRGGISATAPFHWDGKEADFSHLMDDVFTGRMSGPMLDTAEKQALENWVDTIKLLPVVMAGLDPAAVTRGQALFSDASVGCATCHAGALLTNNTTVDVGTGAAFQVPSLRGVSWRAPFMHTGCASTLAGRFDPTCGGGDKHGMTSQLQPNQVSDLVTYLDTL